METAERMEGSFDECGRLAYCTGNTSRAWLVLLLVIHAGLLAWIDARNSPNPDETAHLAAGINIWQSERFSLYPVNPPLVRAVAALPVVYGGVPGQWKALHDARYRAYGSDRPEWSIGIQLVKDNPERAMWFFTLARWACIPLSLMGGYVCWRWAGELYGESAAALALALWVLSPNVMAWSATICPDVAAASFGVMGCYFFWRWLKEPDWLGALLTGSLLGLAELTKMTWVILFAVWPCVWLMWRLKQRRAGRPPWPKEALKLVVILAIGLFVLNLGYSFDGTFTRLGEFTFVSRTLAGKESVVDGGTGGNAFASTWLHSLPVPLPRDYVRGVDLQKVDFERGLPSYLFGQWSPHGWWYYYIVCAMLKVPLGIWAMGLLVVGATLPGWMQGVRRWRLSGRMEGGDGWLDMVALLLPAMALVVFVSSQTGFSRHFRYVLPAFPFLFIWIGSIAPAALRRPRSIGVFVASCLAWTMASSLTVYPHSMSYFNELAGGPRGGPRYLLDANVDWGQDVLYLRDWVEKHPEATTVHVALGNPCAGVFLDSSGRFRTLDVSTGPAHEHSTGDVQPKELGPQPGWYAIGVHRMHEPNKHCQYFQKFTPVATAGYSIYIYHVTLEETNRVRRELGLAELASSALAER
jgi:4-amino-4-deoxy-L-arabinose transferase-like glycosyltransferase